MVTAVTISANDYGARAALKEETLTLEEMLFYALQDEHLALAEYNAIMDEYNITRPYSNIARSEETHIAYVEELYNQLELPIPEVNTKEALVIPTSLEEAARLGVQAELDNIAMYSKFLDQDLPENVREIFSYLRDSSRRHLSAFERQLEKVSFGQGKTANALD